MMRRVLFLVFAAFLINGCGSGSKSSTPYADTTELDGYAKQSEKYVDWRVARVFAVIEKEKFTDQDGWNESEVSELPVLIYSYKEEPRYYEFRIIKSGVEIGAIACNAQKKGGAPVQYVMPFAREYVADTGSGTDSSSKIIDTGYPSRVFQGKSTSGAMSENGSDQKTRTAGDEKIEFEVPVTEFLERADADTLSRLGLKSEEMKADRLKKAREKEAEILKMWDSIEAVKEAILATTDEQIRIAAHNSSQGSKSPLKSSWTSSYIAYPWWSKADWWNPGGVCGPNCLEFLAIGVDCYPGVTGMPSPNDSNALATVYRTFESMVGTGPIFWEHIKAALAYYTPYTLNYDNIFSNKSHNWDKIDSEMRSFGAPALSLRTWASVNGFWTWEWHYRVICGTQRVHTEWMTYFLWWSWISSRNDDYYLMHDNGADGKKMTGGYNWWEVAGSLAQYESVTVKRK